MQYEGSNHSLQFVALLAEGVDRNILNLCKLPLLLVALLAEGVDRNFDLLAQMERLIGVALLAEGVDRNHIG